MDVKINNNIYPIALLSGETTPYPNNSTGIMFNKYGRFGSFIMKIVTKLHTAAISVAMLVLANSAFAVDRGQVSTNANVIEPYEPSTIGYTKDSDDVGFMDFTISLKYRLLPQTIFVLTDNDSEQLYFAFTGRFGMYLETRHSSPVIGKSYNPKIFWRHVTNSGTQPLTMHNANDHQEHEAYNGYIDFGYNHQSNGQSIDSAAEYLAARNSAEKPDYANDNLSRGWDYLEVDWKKTLTASDIHRLLSYVNLRYFLHHGLMQRTAEEYNDWENSSEGKPRKAINGIGATIEYQYGKTIYTRKMPLLANPTVTLKYETGYQSPFKYSTVRIEVGTQMLELPLTFWLQRGYNSDLAQYFKKVDSYGVELRMGTF